MTDAQVRALLHALRVFVAHLKRGDYPGAHAAFGEALAAIAARSLDSAAYVKDGVVQTAELKQHYTETDVPRLEQARAILAALQTFSRQAALELPAAVTELGATLTQIEGMRMLYLDTTKATVPPPAVISLPSLAKVAKFA